MCICKSCCHIRASVFVCVFVLLCHAKVSADAVCFDSLRPLLRFALSLSLALLRCLSLSPFQCCVLSEIWFWRMAMRIASTQELYMTCFHCVALFSRKQFLRNNKSPECALFVFLLTLFTFHIYTFNTILSAFIYSILFEYVCVCDCGRVWIVRVCASILSHSIRKQTKNLRIEDDNAIRRVESEANRILYSTYTHILYILYIFIHLFLFSPLCHSFCSCFCFFHFLYFFVFRMGVENAFGKADCTGFWSCGKLRKQFYQFYGYVSTANAIMHRTHSCPLGSLRAWCWLFVCGPM